MATSARVVSKQFNASTKHTSPEKWEIARSVPSGEQAKDKTSSFLMVRVISSPFFRFHMTRHLASPGQSVIILLSSP